MWRHETTNCGDPMFAWQIHSESIELYDNEKNKYQTSNVAEKQKPLSAELRKELNTWLEQTNDPWIKK